MDLTPDTTKLTAEQRDKLDLYNMSKSQGDALKALEQKMASFTPEMQMKISNLADLKQDLTPILDALKALEAKEQPDTTSAIVDAVGKLEKALGAIDFKPSFTPEVKVDAPQVNVTTPKVNLTGVEKAVKDVSSAVKEAIAQIPTVDVPEADFTPLLEKLDAVLEQLADIDKGVRLKPAPGTMKVTNTDGTSINSTVIQGVVSSKNSSTVNLASNGVFTGLSELVKNYASIQVSVYANQVSAAGGLSLQQSSDGANWDIVETYTIAASTAKTISVQPAASYFRIVYTNGATIQGSFRLQTVYRTVGTSIGAITPGTGPANLGKAEDTPHVDGDTGVAMLAVRDDTLNATSGTEGDYEVLHTTATGALWVTAIPSISGGWTPSFNAAVTTTVKTVKGSQGTLGGWFLWNPNASVAYVQIFDISGSVTLGTSVPVLSLGIPPTSGANVENANGIQFANAIKFACTTTATGLTAPSTGLDCNFWFS